MPPDLPLLSDYLRYGATHFPGRTAFMEGDSTWSYAEASATVDEIAKALIAAGVKRGDRVATLSPPTALALSLFLATASIGAIWVGLNPRYSRRELAHPINDAGPALTFAEPNIDGRDYISDLRDLVGPTALTPLPPGDEVEWRRFLQVGRTISDEALADRRASVDSRDPCLIVYTSGTTGAPKGAMITHHGLVYCSRTDARHNLHSDGQRILCNFPINHIACIGDVCATTLVAGGSVFFMRDFDPARVLRAVQDHRLTHLGQIPVMLQMELSQPDFATYDLSSLRTIMWGGNPASLDLVARLRAICPTLTNVYGLTETTGNVLFARGELSDEQFANSVGAAPEEYEVDLFSADGVRAAAGEIGEIYVRGSFLMKGYWRNPAATQAAFTDDHWLRTGDLAMRREDGLFALVGRRSEMFKSGGYNIYPIEIEQALEAHPAVAIAAVVGVPDTLYTEVGVGFVVRNCATLDEAALRDHCRAHLANFKIPKRFIFIETMPLLPNGKLDKKTLKALAA
jgi:acyl-CoA synthetase (AMP-forming)/AMP-acid ligase II